MKFEISMDLEPSFRSQWLHEQDTTGTLELPYGVPSGQCGPRLAAFTGLLMGHFRQSKRRASLFLGDLLNIPCSAAWTVKIQNLVGDSIAIPYEELRSNLTDQK